MEIEAPSVAILISGQIGRIQGDVVGGDKIVQGLSAEQLLDALDARGLLQRAETGGLERRAILGLAQRLRPGERLNLDQALAELDHAVEVALHVIRRGARDPDLGDFVNAVLDQVARGTQAGDDDANAARIAAALAELDAAHARSRLALLDEGIRIDILRRDAEGVASKIEAIVAIEHPGSVAAWEDAFVQRYHAHTAEGERTGLRMPLEIAAALARRMLATAKDAAQGGVAHYLLATPLALLGAVEADGSRLAEAIAQYRAAVAFFEAIGNAQSRAMTLMMLSHALRVAGEREAGTGTLRAAVEAAEQALALLGPDPPPKVWGTIVMFKGSALARIGEREIGVATLEAAHEAYRQCLDVLPEVSTPEEMASFLLNMANLLRLIGTRTGELQRFEQAAESGRAAVRLCDAATNPMIWGEAQVNLATALLGLGEVKWDSALLDEAIAALEATFGVWHRENALMRWTLVQANLCNAYRMRALLEAGEGRAAAAVASAQAAIDAGRLSLEVWRADAEPLRWAFAQGNLGDAEAVLGAIQGDADLLRAAASRQRAAIMAMQAADAAFDSARINSNLANTLRMLAELTDETTTLLEAGVACEAARQVWTREHFPLLWAQATENLAIIVGQLAVHLRDPARIGQARGHVEGAAAEYRTAGATPRAERVERLLPVLDGLSLD